MQIKTKFYIDGNWVEPEKHNELEVINPSNEKPCAIISLGSQLDTDKAVKSAKKSFNMWWHTSKEEKLKLELARNKIFGGLLVLVIFVLLVFK